MRPVAGMHAHHVSDRRELPGVRVGPAQHLAPVGGQPFGVLRMQARMAERMLGLGIGEAALVPRVGESEHRWGATGGLVDTDLLTGRRGHENNTIADVSSPARSAGSPRRDPAGSLRRTPVDFNELGWRHGEDAHDRRMAIHPLSEGRGVMTRERLGVTLFLLAAVASFLLSIVLWFTDHQDEGVFVGLWVPSILAAGGFWIAAVRTR